jgi:CBS domain containing-hemolysin-like protein
MRLVATGEDLSKRKIEEIIRPPVVVPPTKKVDEMFDFFQANSARAAIVLNEFGGVDGIITMKDVLTFIFGQITGQVKGGDLYQRHDDNEYELPGDMKLIDFNNLTNFGIDDPRMTTIGGVLFRYLDRLPQVGDQAITAEGVMIRVLEMEAHRIVRVYVSLHTGELAKEAEDQQPELKV